MKRFRILLAVLLSVGILFGVNSIALADPGDDGLEVDIVIVGDDANVGVEVQGDNASIYLNGQNINEPTVIRKTSIRTVDKIAREDLEVLGFRIEGNEAKISLTMNGLAKLITQVQGQDSTLSTLLQAIDEDVDKLDSRISSLTIRISGLDTRLSDLEAKHSALVTTVSSKQTAMQEQLNGMQEQLDMIERDYNGKLAIMGFVFLGVALGLGIGLYRKIRNLG